MLDVTPNVQNLWERLYYRFLATGGRGAEQREGAFELSAPAAGAIIARSLCRFEYVARPAGLSRYQFEKACLLQASMKPPFVESGHLILQDRRGAAIWWWDQAALKAEGSADGGLRPGAIPESVGQHLPDGWYHLQLADGFEARHIERGMVIGSAWRRQSFGQSDWEAFVSGEGGALVGPCAPPSSIDARALPVAAKPGGGRALVRAVSWQERAAVAGILAAAILGGWWHGAAAGHLHAAKTVAQEAARLETLIGSYDLFVTARQERARLVAAQTAAGEGTAAIRFAAVLRLIAGHKLQVVDLRLDQSELSALLRVEGPASGLRALAGELEALPHFSQVAASAGARPGEMQLNAKVIR